jgi:hypothetical protein
MLKASAATDLLNGDSDGAGKGGMVNLLYPFEPSPATGARLPGRRRQY